MSQKTHSNDELDALRKELTSVKGRCAQLEHENQLLASGPKRGGGTVVEETGEDSVTHSEDAKRELRGARLLPLTLHKYSTESADLLVAELQRQLTETTRRNTFLEQETHARHNALRQQYEMHIEKLELELQWYRQNLTTAILPLAEKVTSPQEPPRSGVGK